MALRPAEHLRSPASVLTQEPQQLQDSKQVLELWGLPPKGACFVRGPCPDGRFPCPDDLSFTVLGTVYWNPETAVAKYRADFMIRLNQGFSGRGPKGPTRQLVKGLAVQAWRPVFDPRYPNKGGENLLPKVVL